MDVTTAIATDPTPVVNAVRSRKRARHEDGLVTEPELGAMIMEESLNTNRTPAAEGAIPPDAPAWARQLFQGNQQMQQQMQDFQQQMQDFQQQMLHTQQQIQQQISGVVSMLHDLQDRLHNIEARQVNSMVEDGHDPLQPIRRYEVQPAVAPGFPATIAALSQLSMASLNALLGFYGLAVRGTMRDKRMRFLKFIGKRM